MRIYTWTDTDRRTSPTGVGANQELDHQLRIGSESDSQKVLEYGISYCKREGEYTLTVKLMGEETLVWRKPDSDLFWEPVMEGP